MSDLADIAAPVIENRLERQINRFRRQNGADRGLQPGLRRLRRTDTRCPAAGRSRLPALF